ncbi:MAG TPA: nickel-binding protein [Salinimicrobium sp.]|nr:nickel-binding protein [Salinimicrobium sp.]
MPLYMDIHLGVVSVDDTRKAHMADLAVQEKYGVKYHQYWFNEEAGAVYCLIEAPNKESCAATHMEANGFTACHIVEVEGGMHDLFMGKTHNLDHGMVRQEDGEIDNGNRYILTLNSISNMGSLDVIDFNQLKLPELSRKKVLQFIGESDGKEIKTGGSDSFIAVFNTPNKALSCAFKIQTEFLKYGTGSKNEEITFNMGISVGQPLTEKEGFFVRAIQRSHRLCLVAADREIITSRLFEDLCDNKVEVKKQIRFRAIKPSEMTFIDRILDITENRISDFTFGVDTLSKEMWVSMPQLYRKVTAITGRSPVSFIRDIRLYKALSLIKENQFNVTEIALEVGYNNPSYFAKCFHEKFGVNPSKIDV